MRGLIFVPDRDQPGKRDYSAVFRPEALRFAKLHGEASVVEIDVSRKPPLRRADVVRELNGHRGKALDYIAFFCHGWSRGIQTGHDIGNVAQLASAIVSASSARVVVPLYCCSTAGSPLTGSTGGDGGFADSLRDALAKAGATDCRVYGHDRAGHATRLPYARCFSGALHNGGEWLVDPKSPRWRKWVTRLRMTDLRLRFPFLSRTEIEAELDAS